MSSLPYLSSDDLMFFCFMCAALELLLWLKSKKHKGSVSLPTLIRNYQKSHNFYINGSKFGSEGSLEMVLSMKG